MLTEDFAGIDKKKEVSHGLPFSPRFDSFFLPDNPAQTGCREQPQHFRHRYQQAIPETGRSGNLITEIFPKNPELFQIRESCTIR
jgi:hypothetical protein